MKRIEKSEKMKNQPIGMIDSGVGGLTVLREALRQFPNESFYYVADTAHCPYGSKPPVAIKNYVWQMVQFLLTQNIKMLVLACNTASAIFLDELQAALDIPVIGVIQSGSRQATQVTHSGSIGVIATQATVNNGAYQREIHKLKSTTHVYELACPTFVELVESQVYREPRAHYEVDRALAPLKAKAIDTLILGCTHYPLLRPQIEQTMGSSVQIVDAGVESVRAIRLELERLQLTAKTTSRKLRFYTTDANEGFAEIGKRWLNQSHLPVEVIEKSKLEAFTWKKR